MLYEISKNSSSTQQALDKKIRSLQNSAQKKSEQLEKNVRDSSDLQDELKGLKNEEEQRKEAIKRHEKNIVKYEEETREGEPEEADTGDITRRIVCHFSLRQCKLLEVVLMSQSECTGREERWIICEARSNFRTQGGD